MLAVVGHADRPDRPSSRRRSSDVSRFGQATRLWTWYTSTSRRSSPARARSAGRPRASSGVQTLVATSACARLSGQRRPEHLLGGAVHRRRVEQVRTVLLGDVHDDLPLRHVVRISHVKRLPCAHAHHRHVQPRSTESPRLHRPGRYPSGYDGLPMLSFAALAQCFEELEHTSSRKQLTTLLAELLGRSTPTRLPRSATCSRVGWRRCTSRSSSASASGRSKRPLPRRSACRKPRCAREMRRAATWGSWWPSWPRRRATADTGTDRPVREVFAELRARGRPQRLGQRRAQSRCD